MQNRSLFVAFVLISAISRPAFSLEPAKPTTSFQTFIQKQALQLRQNDRPPATSDEWKQRREDLRRNLVSAWGGFPISDCELTPRKLGEFQRDGYRVEKLVFQTRPGVWMTANAYVPDKPGRQPAILHVHGHWAGAKQDRVVQSRCIGCAKLGFFVLCVDAFGAGERGINTKLGEYHGEMTAATLLPVGLPLAGLQVYENQRAVDYLLTRPEVDPQQIGITGASGGGNQTMYAGAIDERLHCVVPTCSVGTYQAYLSAACCLCELVPGGLKFTEEGDILALAANRGLMITSATKDAFQFSVGEAKKSLARVEAVAGLFPGATVRHTIIESPHDYNQSMREAMYGWMTLQLKHEGNGSPISEPAIQPEDPELLRCYPGGSRPDDFITIPRFAAAEVARLSQRPSISTDGTKWRKDRTERQRILIEQLGGIPNASPLHLKAENEAEGRSQQLTFETEPELTLFARRDLPERPDRLAVVLDLEGGVEQAWTSDFAKGLRDEGWKVVTPELRATGQFAVPRDKIGHAIDHNSAEWSLWIGRPLLGQWSQDVRRTLDAIAEHDGSLPREILVVGHGSAGIVALCAGALDERISRVKAIDSLASYATDQAYRGFRLGLIVPGILRDFGDIADMAALIAPRTLTISGGTSGTGVSLIAEDLTKQFANTKRMFELLDASNQFVIESK